MGCGSTKVSGLQSDADQPRESNATSESSPLIERGRGADTDTAPAADEGKSKTGADDKGTSRINQNPSPHRTFSSSTTTSTGVSKIRVTLSTDGSLIEIEKEEIDRQTICSSSSGSAADNDIDPPGGRSESPPVSSSPSTSAKCTHRKDKSQAYQGLDHLDKQNLQKTEDVSHSKSGSLQRLQESLNANQVTSSSDNSNNSVTTTTTKFDVNSATTSTPSQQSNSPWKTQTHNNNSNSMQKSKSSDEIKLKSKRGLSRHKPTQTAGCSSTLPASLRELRSINDQHGAGDIGAGSTQKTNAALNDSFSSGERSNPLLSGSHDLDDSYNTEDEGIFMNPTLDRGTLSYDGGDLGVLIDRNEASTPELISNLCATSFRHQMKTPKRNFSSPALLQNGVHSPSSSPISGKTSVKKKDEKYQSPKRPESSKERLSTKSRLLRFSQRTKEQFREFSKKMSGSFGQSSESETAEIQNGPVTSEPAVAASEAITQSEKDCDLGVFTDLQDVMPAPDYVHQEFFNDFGDCFDDEEL